MRLYLFQIKNGIMMDECKCECKELDNWGPCKDNYVWNPSRCEFQRNKVSKTDKYSDIKNCTQTV